MAIRLTMTYQVNLVTKQSTYGGLYPCLARPSDCVGSNTHMSKTATLSHLAFRNKLARTRESSRVYFEAKYQEISWHMCGLRDFNIHFEKHACITISSTSENFGDTVDSETAVRMHDIFLTVVPARQLPLMPH
jgi:hypothetical protein